MVADTYKTQIQEQKLLWNVFIKNYNPEFDFFFWQIYFVKLWRRMLKIVSGRPPMLQLLAFDCYTFVYKQNIIFGLVFFYNLFEIMWRSNLIPVMSLHGLFWWSNFICFGRWSNSSLWFVVVFGLLMRDDAWNL